jgi:tRNA threonylcarbamoyl adenosine modification protein (Sua5/YciO/YrdC/YwlC family)
LVVLPTDTVYGVAADLWNEEAVEALYAAKGRVREKAIPILLAGVEDALQVAVNFPDAARRLADAFWPGPLTLAVPKRPDVLHVVSAYPTIGLRVPDHDGARAVIRAAGGALAVTSANRSDAPNSLTAQEAADALGEAVSLVLDGGRCPGGQPSTVVDLSGDALRVVRQGPLSEADLRKALTMRDAPDRPLW